LKTLLDLLEIIFITTLLSLTIYMVTPIKTDKNIHLPKGANAISYLKSKGYSVGFIDEWILEKLGGASGGWLYIGKSKLRRLDFLNRLSDKKAYFKRITLIPGETTVIFFDLLAKELDLNATLLNKNFKRVSPFKEAGILANTYNIPIYYNEKQVISYLVNLTKKSYKRLAKRANLNYKSKEWKEILIKASIIQKEAGNKKEMPLIASVIENRLKRRMRLQMDGTLNYGRYSHIRVTPKRIREDNTTFNTYKHRGLPSEAVCNVSKEAIESALHPAKTKYLYFFLNSRGVHDFFTNYKEHLKSIRRKKKEERKRLN